MLFDFLVAMLIILGGVALYYTLLGSLILYNKIVAGKDSSPSQMPPLVSTEAADEKSSSQNAPVKLAPIQQEARQPRFGQKKSGSRQEIMTSQNDPLRLEHKKREEEFRLKMQQRNEELLRELKQRREESQLEQDTTAGFQKDIISADEIPGDATNNLDNTVQLQK